MCVFFFSMRSSLAAVLQGRGERERGGGGGGGGRREGGRERGGGRGAGVINNCTSLSDAGNSV